jgi:DNA invertase Pin-like site-specific DNA recombinase
LGLTEELQQRGVEFFPLKDHIDTNSAIGKAMFRMLAGLQAARKRGRDGGKTQGGWKSGGEGAEAIRFERIQRGRDYRNDRGVESDALPAAERVERLKRFT